MTSKSICETWDINSRGACVQVIESSGSCEKLFQAALGIKSHSFLPSISYVTHCWSAWISVKPSWLNQRDKWLTLGAIWFRRHEMWTSNVRGGSELQFPKCILARNIQSPSDGWSWLQQLSAERDFGLTALVLFSTARLSPARKSPLLPSINLRSIDLWKRRFMPTPNNDCYFLKFALSRMSRLVTPSCEPTAHHGESGFVRLEENSVTRSTFHCQNNCRHFCDQNVNQSFVKYSWNTQIHINMCVWNSQWLEYQSEPHHCPLCPNQLCWLNTGQ